MEFEWDEAKRQCNIKDHKIDFYDVVHMFGLSNTYSFKDDRRNYGETRLVLLCVEKNELFHITHTLRGSTIRIISARRGNKRERRRYDNAQKDHE